MTPPNIATNVALIESDVVKRFIRYARIDTTSNRHQTHQIPSTENQRDLLRLLNSELREIGITDITETPHGFLIARIPASPFASKTAPTIALLTHVDTTDDFIGKGVQPQTHPKWNGKPIALNEHYTLDPKEYPEMLRYRGQTIITANGDTLLGADDKAGVAEVMTAAAYLTAHPEIPRGPVELIFCPDEENGIGIRSFPYDIVKARYAYTIDGGEEGSIETECFNAYKVRVKIEGNPTHPGTARGKMINPLTIAAKLLTMLPQNESPEAADGRDGFYCPQDINGNLIGVSLSMLIRDYDIEITRRRMDAIDQCALALEHLYPGSRISVTRHKQYLNMRSAIDQNPCVAQYALDAIRQTGIEPTTLSIRGGTDGAQITEKGIPAPNIFTGAHNMHSRYEWIAQPAMTRAVQTIIHLIAKWSHHQEPEPAQKPSPAPRGNE